MKKIVFIVLALVLSMAMATVLWADGSTSDPSASSSSTTNGSVTRGADSSVQDSSATRGADSSTMSSDMQTDSSMRGAGMTMAQGSKASQLLNKDVKNLQGEKLGKITDIVIDPARSRVGYVALQADTGDRMYAIPFQALTIDPSTNAITINVSKSKLQSAPSFAKNQWPDITNTQWLSDVHRYYGLTPTW